MNFESVENDRSSNVVEFELRHIASIPLANLAIYTTVMVNYITVASITVRK